MNMLKVNGQRLREDIEALSKIGRGESQGVYRTAFSDADMQARTWLKQRIADAKLDCHQDGAGNIFARLNWRDGNASVMAGSHIDSVPGGGYLDGALGVLAGLESLRRIQELGLKPRRPLESVAFSDEEGRFGGIFGSRALCGHLSPDDIHAARDLAGITLVDAMARQGLNAMDALSASRRADSIWR